MEKIQGGAPVKARFIVKLILGLMLVAALIFICYRLTDSLAGLIGDIFSGGRIEDGSGDYELYTPEPMPTMPDYMRDDSFYDNADSMDFGEE